MTVLPQVQDELPPPRASSSWIADRVPPGRTGSSRPPRSATGPWSRDDARAMGDPSGFAPTARPPAAFVHRGREIPLEEAVRRGLACTEDGTAVVRCEDP